MKWLKSFLLVLLSCVGLLFMASESQAKAKTPTTIYLSDTAKVIHVPDCTFDTIRLGERTKLKNKGKRYYYTDKECTVVEVDKKEKSWITILAKFIRKVLKV